MPRTHDRRGLRAVVFVDTVGSTGIAAELGYEGWQRLLLKELTILRGALKDRGGHEVDVAGDGLFAVFDEPAQAVATEDHLWIVDRGGLVEVVDPLTKKIRKGIPIGGEPVDVAAGAGAVWVADRDGRLVRIDTSAEEVDGVFEIDGRPSSVAVDDGEGVVWVRTRRRRTRPRTAPRRAALPRHAVGFAASRRDVPALPLKVPRQPRPPRR